MGKAKMFFNYFNYLIDNASLFLRYQTAVTELNNLTDEELNDIGLTRGEILVETYKALYNK